MDARKILSGFAFVTVWAMLLVAILYLSALIFWPTTVLAASATEIERVARDG